MSKVFEGKVLLRLVKGIVCSEFWVKFLKYVILERGFFLGLGCINFNVYGDFFILMVGLIFNLC